MLYYGPALDVTGLLWASYDFSVPGECDATSEQAEGPFSLVKESPNQRERPTQVIKRPSVLRRTPLRANGDNA